MDPYSTEQISSLLCLLIVQNRSAVCFALFHPRPVALFFNTINQVYSFFILSNLFFNYFFVCFNPIFSSYLDLRFFHPFLVNIPEDLFPSSISLLQISMKCLTLASHESALSPILQSSTNKYFMQFSRGQSPSKQCNSKNNSNKLENMLRTYIYY